MKKPKYELIADYLIERIDSQYYKEGDVILSENELAELFNVSRMTAKRALDKLSTSGLVYRVRGKGTIVSEKKVVKDKSLVGFRNSLKLGKDTSSLITETISFTKIFPSNTIIGALRLDSKEMVFEVKRLRVLNNTPIGVESSYLSVDRFDGLDSYDLSKNSLYTILNEHYNVLPNFTNQNVASKEHLEDNVTKYLFASGKGITLDLTFITFDQLYNPFEYTEASYRADKFELNQNVFSNRVYKIEGD